MKGVEPQPDSITPNPRDFWLFWLGQIISSLGSSVTAFALPLIYAWLGGLTVVITVGFFFTPLGRV
jgi:hypothetical protein